jgi:pyruvate formate lyase activating enzyme
MTDPENTTTEMLLHAAEIGHNAGLRYIYAGNLPGDVGGWENTYCYNCNTILIERYGYLIQDYKLTPEGGCPKCGVSIPGRWAEKFQGQITSHPFLPRRRGSLFRLS